MSDASPDNVRPLPTRWTYLDACRKQGVHQKDEEFRAEIFENRGKLAAMRTEARKTTERLDGEPRLAIVGGEQAPHMTEAEPVRARVETILAAYAAAGFGDAHFPLLQHLILEPAFRAEYAEGVFAAVPSIQRRSAETVAASELMDDATLHECRRLGLDDPREQEPYGATASPAGRREPENHPGSASHKGGSPPSPDGRGQPVDPEAGE